MTSDPDQIRSSIEQTQQNLSADVDALAEKISPAQIVNRRVQQTRSAVTSLKDSIMGSTSDATSAVGGTVGSAAGSARDAAASAKDTLAATASSAADLASSAPQQARRRVRGNPLAAGLVAFGAGWLLSSLLPATAPEQQAAAQIKDLTVEKGRPVAQELGQAGQDAARQLRESAQQRAQSVRDTAADAASAVVDEAQSQASDVTDHAQQAGSRVAGHASPDESW
jgi:cell division septum initiation protein DivIVA